MLSNSALGATTLAEKSWDKDPAQNSPVSRILLSVVDPMPHREWLPVSSADLDMRLASVAHSVLNPEQGIFGPSSISWKINRESALFLGAGRAALLQLAHPWVAAALAQHSNLLADPIARFHNTFRVVFSIIFGTLDQARNAARNLHALHSGIRGQVPTTVASYPKGSIYEANEVGALRWVYATLVESALLAYECVLPPLTDAEREAYYQESKLTGAFFGLPQEKLPQDWASFKEYNRQMWESDELGISDLSRSMANAVLSGAGSWIHPPHWYRALTASWIPPKLRAGFEFELNSKDRKACDQALQWLPRIYGRLPSFLRFVGPYQEATHRLQGRPANSVIRYSNRFWIGQPRLPEAGNRS